MAVRRKELISRAEYARRKGVAPRTIGKYCQRKIIPLHNDKIDPVEADKILAKFLVEPLGSGRRVSGNKTSKMAKQSIPDNIGPDLSFVYTPESERQTSSKSKNNKDLIDFSGGDRLTNTYVEARTREKNLKVELLELDLQLKKGEMVLSKDVEVAAFTLGRAVRDKMLNIPDRISAIVAAEMDEMKVRGLIMGEIERELMSVVPGDSN